MSAQDLSLAEILTATLAWTGGPPGSFVRSSPISSPFIPHFDRLRARIAEAPPEDSELGRITAQLAQLDSDHDRFVRFAVEQLASYEHHADHDVRSTAQSLKSALLPEGVSLVNRSYDEEAGRGEARAHVLSEAVANALKTFPIAPVSARRTLDDVIADLQRTSAQIGSLVQRRRALAADTSAPTATELLASKRQLIAVVEQVFQSFRMLNDSLDGTARNQVQSLTDAWERSVHDATARARRRRDGEPEAPTPAPGS